VLEPEIIAQFKKYEYPKPSNKCKKVLLVGSSHSRGLSDRLHSVLGYEYTIISLFKPNAALHNVVVDLKTSSKDMTMDDHVIIVGGPGNSLDIDSNYQIEKDLNSITNDSINTNVRFVGLLEHHDKPHMNRWVMDLNMELEHALWTADRSHIGLIDYHPLIDMAIPDMDYTLIQEARRSLCISLLTVLVA
jgi:trans-2-enoyl-CoA reductase